MEEHRPKLSIVICTFNRADLLEFCLDSLAKQSAQPKDFEVIVVANNCTDSTGDVVDRAKDTLTDLRLVQEPRQGLSHARNRGAIEVKSDWIFYLDDDALADEDLVKNAISFIQEVGGDVFGGQYKPWYHFGKPEWFKDEYGSSSLSHDSRTVLSSKREFLSGGVFCLRTSVFQKFGGFDPILGMNGTQIGYGEETEYQKLLRAGGVKIWYDPALLIHHVVKPQLLFVDWHLKAGWALGRDKVLSGNLPKSKWFLLFVAITGFSLTLFDLVLNGIKLAFLRNYYIENWWIDSFRKAAKRAAILYTASLQK